VATRNGDKYEGSFKDGKFHGRASVKYANGDVLYDATYEAGVLKWGYMEHNNGIFFRGNFKKNKYHGENGELSLNNGDRYKGEFKDGLKHGKFSTWLTEDGKKERKKEYRHD